MHEYREYLPTGLLKKYVKHFYIFNSSDTNPERILPFGSVEMTVNLRQAGSGRGGGDDNAIFINNPGTRSYFVVPKALRSVGVSFWPWGLYGLFKISPGEMGECKILLGDVFPVAELVHRVEDSCDPKEITAILQRFLLRLARNEDHEMVRDAVSFIDGCHGQLHLPELFSRYYLSPRRLEQVFERAIGMSPKKYSRLKRFHFAVTQLKKGCSLTDIALNNGYYDQAHFIHEFSRFAGVSPRAFLKERNTLNAINARTWFGG